MGDGFLHRYFLNNPSKRLHKMLHYFDIYERHFERFRGKAPVVLEIGVMGGGSLAMWRTYFGDESRIVGLDINPLCKQHEAEGIDIFIGSQADEKTLQSVKAKYPRIDIVIDDGSHRSPHMIASFEHLYDHVQPYGIYLVEDTFANYQPKWGGGVKSPGSFMEFSKDKIDEINAAHTKDVIPISSFTSSTNYIAIYDSVVVFEKQPQGSRLAPITFGMSLPVHERQGPNKAARLGTAPPSLQSPSAGSSVPTHE